VGLLDGFDPIHAPHPNNGDEQLVFGHLYDTLIRVDCGGEVQPGLAESWAGSEGGRRWRFRLRRDLRFWDGVKVSASAVRAAWEDGPSRRAARLAGIDSLRVEGEREIEVFLERGEREPPRLLAASTFAVVRRLSESEWPVGTGRYRVDASSREAVVTSPVAGGRPTISFAAAGHRDARDLLDRGVDLLVTANPAVIEYSQRLDYERIALPWDRTYLLLSTTRARALQLGGAVGGLPARLLDSMARDAVRGDARGHAGPPDAGGDFWELGEACGVRADPLEGLPPVPRGAYASAGARRIVYEASDPVARGLAERVAALSAGGSGTSQAAWLAAAIPGLGDADERALAHGMTRDELETSLRDGDDFAYVVPVPLDPLDACYERRGLVSRAQWLGAEELDLSAAVLPLVDTRRQAVVRPGRLGLSLGWGGTVRIEGVATDGGEQP
jgi:hypothetical protein